jgi:hypothetical protein
MPVIAGAKKKRTLAECTTFTQSDQGDDAVALGVRNSCRVPVDCSISWRVVCAPDTKRRAVHASSAKFTLTEGGEQTEQASAAVCGDDGWTIDAVQWGCEPSKD